MQSHGLVLKQIIYTEIHDKMLNLIRFIKQHASVQLPSLFAMSRDELSDEIYSKMREYMQQHYPQARKKYTERRKRTLNPEKYKRIEKRKKQRP